MNTKILVVDDEIQFCQLYSYTLSQAGFLVQTVTSAEQALSAIQKEEPAMVISDIRLPGINGVELLKQVRLQKLDIPFLLVTAYADLKDAVTALKNGAVDYLEKPIDLDELVTSVRDALGISHSKIHKSIPKSALQGIVAESDAMQNVLQNAYQVAKSDASLFITGESGTGKEILANFIHKQSCRFQHPMIAVNCSAIAPTLFTSELFGHEKGAFTGASKQRLGRFREANKGTLFLDEVGDMPLELQPPLLRVLETKCVTPVGSDRKMQLDFRIIAATNKNIHKGILEGWFREDLFYRLNVVSLELPSLRDRKKDIIPLAKYFLSNNASSPKRLSKGVTKILTNYSWPGNIRELANAIEHACLLSNTSIVLPEHLPPFLKRTYEEKIDKKEDINLQPKTLKESEIEAIKQALEQTRGNRTQAAKLLDITRRGLLIKLKRYKLDV